MKTLGGQLPGRWMICRGKATTVSIASPRAAMLFAPLKAIGKELPEIFGAQITASGVPDSGSHYIGFLGVSLPCLLLVLLLSDLFLYFPVPPFEMKTLTLEPLYLEYVNFLLVFWGLQLRVFTGSQRRFWTFELL
jgi:hypothetical protein